MERIALLTLVRADELEWREILTDYFRKTGDYLSYALFPSLILTKRDTIDGEIDIRDGIIKLSPVPVHNGFCWVLPAEALEPGSGLFLTRGRNIGEYTFPCKDVRVSGAALVETDESSYRIIRKRHLSRDRAS